MRGVLTRIGVVGMVAVSVIFAACGQLNDANILEKEVNPPAGEAKEISANPVHEPVAPAWSDYLYNKGQEITVESDYVAPVLAYQENKERGAYILRILRDEIVPRAVTTLVKVFPQSFAWLEDREIGMGITLTSLAETSTKGSMYIDIPLSATADGPVSCVYGLTVGYGHFEWQSDSSLQSHYRKELEGTVVHEMMHALMCETLTYGFTGISSDMIKEAKEAFPVWFREGTASAVDGNARLVRQLIGRKYALSRMEDQYVREFLSEHGLTKGNYNSNYQTGYLATMYLGYLANGGESIDPQSIAAGLDIIMSQIHRGKSLSQAIADNSQNKFSSLKDFEAKFTDSNSEVVIFITNLLNIVGSGRGSLLARSWGENGVGDDDILPDEAVDTRLFWLYARRETYTNKFHDEISAREMFKGGAATKSGVWVR